MFSRLAPYVGLVAFAIGLTGCLGYRTGTSLPSSISSIYVRSFENKSSEPDIETATTSATVREFQKDGSVRMASSNDADAIVEATVTGLSLEPLRYSKDRATETTEFRLFLDADVILRDRRTGKVLATHSGIRGKTTFDPAGDLSGAKRLAIPLAAQDLAHLIVAAVVEAW